MVRGVGKEPIPIGMASAVGIGHATRMHLVVEHKAAELGGRKSRRFLGGLAFEHGGHDGREELPPERSKRQGNSVKKS